MDKDQSEELKTSNSHAADFLTGIIKSKSVVSSLATPTDVIQQWFPVTYTVTKEQRQTLLDAIRKAKCQWGLKTSAEAIAHICQLFLVG